MFLCPAREGAVRRRRPGRTARPSRSPRGWQLAYRGLDVLIPLASKTGPRLVSFGGGTLTPCWRRQVAYFATALSAALRRRLAFAEDAAEVVVLRALVLDLVVVAVCPACELAGAEAEPADPAACGARPRSGCLRSLSAWSCFRSGAQRRRRLLTYGMSVWVAVPGASAGAFHREAGRIKAMAKAACFQAAGRLGAAGGSVPARGARPENLICVLIPLIPLSRRTPPDCLQASAQRTTRR